MISNKTMYIYIKNLYYGVGISSAVRISSRLGFQKNMRFEKRNGQILLGQDLKYLVDTNIVKQFSTGENLKNKVKANIKLLTDIKSYRGIFHSLSKPVRGQRTKTNSQTRRLHRNRGY